MVLTLRNHVIQTRLLEPANLGIREVHVVDDDGGPQSRIGQRNRCQLVKVPEGDVHLHVVSAERHERQVERRISVEIKWQIHEICSPGRVYGGACIVLARENLKTWLIFKRNMEIVPQLDKLASQGLDRLTSNLEVGRLDRPRPHRIVICIGLGRRLYKRSCDGIHGNECI